MPMTIRLKMPESGLVRRSAAGGSRLARHVRMRTASLRRPSHRPPLDASGFRQVSRVSMTGRRSPFRLEIQRMRWKKSQATNQSGTPGNALANPFVVEVQDEDGEPLTGHSVTFSVTAGGGSLSETSVTADEDGLAETTLTLGSERGVNSVRGKRRGCGSRNLQHQHRSENTCRRGEPSGDVLDRQWHALWSHRCESGKDR